MTGGVREQERAEWREGGREQAGLWVIQPGEGVGDRILPKGSGGHDFALPLDIALPISAAQL